MLNRTLDRLFRIRERTLVQKIILHSIFLEGKAYGRKLNLKGANLSGPNIWGEELAFRILCNKRFDFGNIAGARFSHHHISGTDFKSVVGNGARFSHVSLSSCSFSHANLMNADFSYSQLFNIDFSHSLLNGVSFINTSIHHCDFSHADLSECDLSRADFSRTKDEFFKFLSALDRPDIEHLYRAFEFGLIDGQYLDSDLLGTVAHYRGLKRMELPPVLISFPELSIDKLLFSVKIGDTPRTNQMARLASEWLAEFMGDWVFNERLKAVPKINPSCRA